MRAIAKIQPPETAKALPAGLKDACGDVRMLASAGWMNAAAIGEQAIPDLVEALGDPEVRVRANCAHALARLDTIPAAAIPLLVECTLDADDGLRTNAAMALSLAPAGMVAEVMHRFVADSSSRMSFNRRGARFSPRNRATQARAPSFGKPLEDPALRVRGGARVAGVARFFGCGSSGGAPLRNESHGQHDD